MLKKQDNIVLISPNGLRKEFVQVGENYFEIELSSVVVSLIVDVRRTAKGVEKEVHNPLLVLYVNRAIVKEIFIS